MKKFCSFPRKHATNVINFEKNATVNKKGLKTASNSRACYIIGGRSLKIG